METDRRYFLEGLFIIGFAVAMALFFVWLAGNANAKTLLSTTTEGQIPEIPSAKSNLATVVDELPKVVERFAALENQTKKILADVGQTTSKIKDDPSVLLKGPKEKSEKSSL